jgi:branched-subunit amino acid aminotransferase/4-amino-4-deoxychorismate lyase
VPGDAPAVERGVGLFETVLAIGRRKVLWAPHVERLLGGLGRWELPAPGRDEIEAAAEAALADVPDDRDERALRLTWLAAGADLEVRASWRLDVSLRPIPALTLQRREGSRAVSLPPELARDTPALKSTSYLAAVLGLRHAARRGADEGLLLGPDGSYVEGTATTLVAWDGGRLLLSRHAALPGVTAAAFVGPAEAPRGALTAQVLREGAIVLGSLTGAAPLLSLDGEPCAVPPPMRDRIAAFNRQMRG